MTVLGLWAGILHAQDARTDSLRQVLRTLPQDTHRVDVLLLLAERVANGDYKEALGLLDASLALADSLHYAKGLADTHAEFGELQNNLGAYPQSIAHATQAYRGYALLGDTTGLARALITIGLVQYGLKQYPQAIETLQAAAKCYGATDNTRGMLSAKHNIGVVYMAAGDTAKAKQQYFNNLKTIQGTRFWHIYAATYNNLGNLFNPVTEGDSAIWYYSKALEYKYMATSPAKGSIGNSLLNIAGVHLKNGRFALAKDWLDQATPMVVASNEKSRLLELHRLTGELALATGNYKESALAFQAQTIVQDSLYGPQIAEQASRLEAAFQSENQKQEIELLNKAKALDDAEKTRWRWIATAIAIGLGLTITLLVVVAVRSRERTRMYKLIQQKTAEIKQQQREIVLQNEALSLQNKRLADLNLEKDGLIGIVAHDIRAPFNRSMALAELISSIGNLSPEQERYLQMIRKVSNDGGKLIQDLLELNSYEQNAQRVELANCDLLLALEHSQHGFAGDAALKDIEITLAGSSTFAKTDEKLLGRILDNLISNAVKFTPKGKRVYLSIESDADRHWILIRDEGPGINAADQAKMFQKFQRLSARPTGGESSTGLGLSIVRALADHIGAELSFESAVGQGTTFKVGILKTA